MMKAFQPAMIDPFGRRITYLRVSVTDRCDFRCVYCMAELTTFLPRKDLLTLVEREQILARQERHGLGHAIDATEIAAVGDRDPQIGDTPAEGVDHGLARHASSLSALCAPRLALCGYRPWRS